MEHTASPWEVIPESIRFSEPYGYTIDTKEGHITFIHNDHKDQKANARLIAAAPDLLETLKSIQNDLNSKYEWGMWSIARIDFSANPKGELDPKTRVIIESVVKKAEGKE